MDETNIEDRRLIIDEEYYYKLYEMIDSSDKSNFELAVQIIENMDYEDNFVYILFLFRSASKQSKGMWSELAPKSYAFCESLRTQYSMNIIGLHNTLKGRVSPEQERFVDRQFATQLMKTLHNYGYDFIEDIEFKIKW